MTKRFYASCAVILFFASLSVASAPLRAQGPTVPGSWDFSVETPQGTRNFVLVIKQDGGKLSGAAKSAAGERPLDRVELKDKEITLVMTIQFGGQDMVITYKGMVEKDSMKGDADFGGLAQGTWSATPHKEGGAPAAAATPSAATSGADISGVWNVTVESPLGTGTPVFTFKQEGGKLTGTYKGRLGEAAVTGTISGNDVKFSMTANAQGQELTVTYTGKLEGKDKMSGTADFGGQAEGKWSGKKQ